VQLVVGRRAREQQRPAGLLQGRDSRERRAGGVGAWQASNCSSNFRPSVQSASQASINARWFFRPSMVPTASTRGTPPEGMSSIG